MRRQSTYRFGRVAAGTLALALATLSAVTVSRPVLAERALEMPAVARAAERAAEYYANVLSVGGGYAWGYTPDLSVRYGKGGPVGPGTGLARPPGTPAVGAAFLRLHAATGDPRWLDAATQAAHALTTGQLASGGWALTFETDPAARKDWCYVADGTVGDACKALKNKERNRSILDDNITQSVIRFLIWYDEETGRTDAALGQAIDRAVGKLSKAVYPNGACPLEMPVDDRDQAVAKGLTRLPTSWSRTWVKPGAAGPYYILNDNLQRDCMFAFLVAERRTGDGRYVKIARRIGDFLLRTQLPDPHPGWAQTYDRNLEPVWGRTFEPPAVATSETAGAIHALLELYAVTGDESYRRAADKAARWLLAMRRSDNTWVRFHELGTGRPLFVDHERKLTYSDAALFEGYGFIGTFDIPSVLRFAEEVAHERPSRPIAWWSDPTDGASAAEVEARARSLIEDQLEEGAWRVGDLIDSATFVEAMFVFSRLLPDQGVALIR